MSGLGTPAIPSTGGGGGSSTITSFLGSTTSGPVNITQIGGASFALGQQLAGASLPVVLTASQLTTLTPPTTITANQGGAPWQVKVTDASDSSGDAIANTNTSIFANNGSPVQMKILAYAYNGTTWDRMRSANSGAGTTGSGILGAGLLGFDGTNWQKISTDTSGLIKENITQIGGNNVASAGANGVLAIGGNQVPGSAISTNAYPVQMGGSDYGGTPALRALKIDSSGQIYIGNTVVSVGGDTASGSSDAGNPIKTGGIAKTSLPTAVSDGQRVGGMFDKFGRQVFLPHGMRDLILPITQLTLTSTTTETTLISQVASTFLDLLTLIVINTSATATQVDFRDSTGGTIRASVYVPAGETRGVAINGILPQNTVNNNWTAKCGTSVASVIITGNYITNK